MIKLRPYQQELYDQITEAIQQGQRKILCQAETGYGKSIIIGHLANNLPGRTLILTHRIELLNQNSEWITNLGILTANVKKNEPLKTKQRVISMAQTAHARFKRYGSDYVGDFDNVIIDETHLGFFEKVYSQLGNIKLFGFTATPILNKSETKIIDEEEFTRKLTMSSLYDVIFQGIKTKELIELGYLTEDFNYMLTPPNLEKLKNSSTNPDGYTSASMTEVFGSHTSIKNVLDGYNKHGIGKKTLIFNPTTKVNKEMFEVFKSHGINCRMFDSVNERSHSRKETTDWFQQDKDAVLLNVGVFTTGFSVNELEVIIYNKKTKSLALFLQSIGRGSRTSDKILKDKFLVLDMALNIKEHGRWSKTRDWSKVFFPKSWKKKKESDLLQVWECKKCGEYNLRGEFYNQELDRVECGNCGEPKPPPKPPKTVNGKLIAMDKPNPPRAKQIIEHTEKQLQDANFAFKLAEEKIVELFLLHDIEQKFFDQNRVRFAKRFKQIYQPIYFSIINSKLKGANKKLSTQLNKTWTKIVNIYIT